MPDPLPLIVGFHGRKLGRASARHLRRIDPVGILILPRNIETPGQTRALIEDVRQSLGRKIIASIDHEGGWVVRFQSGATAFPGNAALGKMGDAGAAYAVGRRMAQELSPLGITLNLAPVMDVLGPRYNPGILIRSFSSDSGLCARLGSAFLRGLQDHGVWACAKHFPGKGAAAKDAHYELPVIRLSRARMARHLKPFTAAANAGVGCVMSSHVLVPSLDREPATFSRAVVFGLLRRKMRYGGVIISDDLGMGGATTMRDAPQAAKDALLAGHDLLIIAHDADAQARAAEALRQTLSGGLIPEEERRASIARVKMLLTPPRKIGRASAQKISASRGLDLTIARKAAALIRPGALALPIPSSDSALVIVPDFREVADLFSFEGGPLGPKRFLSRFLRGKTAFSLAESPILSADPSRLARLDSRLSRAATAVFLCFEAMRFAGQRAALSLACRRLGRKTAVCLIRNPWDLSLIPSGITALDALGFRNCQLQAAAEIIFGLRRPS
ncbi:MAG: glycoside hydrolase family 3 N-terminal domain-containing protein [Elusimicrobiota bacterium]